MAGPPNTVDDTGQEPSIITFWYVNYQGDNGYRRVKPISFRFGVSEWHKEPQWLMLADDTINDKRREFAVKDMSGVVGTPTIWIHGVTY